MYQTLNSAHVKVIAPRRVNRKGQQGIRNNPICPNAHVGKPHVEQLEGHHTSGMYLKTVTRHDFGVNSEVPMA